MVYAPQARLGPAEVRLPMAESDASTPIAVGGRLKTANWQDVAQGAAWSGVSYDLEDLLPRSGPEVAQIEGSHLVWLDAAWDIWHTFARPPATHDYGRCFVLTNFAGPRGVTMTRGWSGVAEREHRSGMVAKRLLPDRGMRSRFWGLSSETSGEETQFLRDLVFSITIADRDDFAEVLNSATPLAERCFQVLYYWMSSGAPEPLPLRDEATTAYVAAEGLESEVRTAWGELRRLFDGALVEIELLAPEEESEGPILVFEVCTEDLGRIEFRRRAREFHEWLRDAGYLSLYGLASVVRA